MVPTELVRTKRPRKGLGCTGLEPRRAIALVYSPRLLCLSSLMYSESPSRVVPSGSRSLMIADWHVLPWILKLVQSVALVNLSLMCGTAPRSVMATD